MRVGRRRRAPESLVFSQARMRQGRMLDLRPVRREGQRLQVPPSPYRTAGPARAYKKILLRLRLQTAAIGHRLNRPENKPDQWFDLSEPYGADNPTHIRPDTKGDLWTMSIHPIGRDW